MGEQSEMQSESDSDISDCDGDGNGCALFRKSKSGIIKRSMSSLIGAGKSISKWFYNSKTASTTELSSNNRLKISRISLIPDSKR